jgi:cephalosporin hydroxylase
MLFSSSLNQCINKFHQHYEEQRIWERTSWMGVPMWKLPFDALVLQEIISTVRPDMIIETGTGRGGSALFYSSLMNLMEIPGIVVTVDVEDKVSKAVMNRHATPIWDKYVTQLIGSSVSDHIVKDIEKRIVDRTNIMVILDSWHSYDHVLKELDIYSSMVSIDSYLIVEDTHVSGHPIKWAWGKGPFEAVQEFLKYRTMFKRDEYCERHLMTFNPSGYLRRTK